MFNRFGIRKGDKVLDVGCGAFPFPFATHLTDASLTDNSERSGMPIPRTALPLFECPVESMPFHDGEFDFVYCAHVLEHVADPRIACRELMRVGRRGYIECPRSWVEYAFHSPEHRWLVDHEQGRLIFREKLDEEKRDFLGIQYSIFEWSRHDDFRQYWNSPQIRAVRNVEFYWEGKFDIVVVSKEERKNAEAHAWFYSMEQPRRYKRTRSELRAFLSAELERTLNGHA